MFWWSLGTCDDRKDLLRLICVTENNFWNAEFYLSFGDTWVHVTTEKDLLRLVWVGENYFETVGSYLCLSCTWVFISTGNGLENDFRQILFF